MKPKDDVPSKMLRLDSKLWGKIETTAKRAGRTLRQEVEARLHDSLSAVPGDAASPASALSRLIELHAGDVAAYCQSAEEWQTEMKISVPALMNELFGEAKLESGEGAEGFAAMAARTLAQKVRRAHLPTAPTGDPVADRWAQEADRAVAQVQPSLAQLQHEELLKLQQALHILPETVEGIAQVSRSKAQHRERK